MLDGAGVSGRLDAHKHFHCSAHVGPVIRFCHRKQPAVLQGATFAQQHGQPAIQCVQALGGIVGHGSNLRLSLTRRCSIQHYESLSSSSSIVSERVFKRLVEFVQLVGPVLVGHYLEFFDNQGGVVGLRLRARRAYLMAWESIWVAARVPRNRWIIGARCARRTLPSG